MSGESRKVRRGSRRQITPAIARTAISGCGVIFKRIRRIGNKVAPMTRNARHTGVHWLVSRIAASGLPRPTLRLPSERETDGKLNLALVKARAGAAETSVDCIGPADVR
jgi:hypothetical protein